MNTNGSAKPVLRMIHLLARCGGTLISKCLGAMSGVVLLSEIHPDQINNRDAVHQADDWFNLFDPNDKPFLERHWNNEISFAEGIRKVQEKCLEKNKFLIIRDWNHIDFTGRPRNRDLPMKLSAAEILKEYFEIKRICIIRHPLDQWLSFRKSQNKLGIVGYEFFMKGYAEFAQITKDFPHIKYEEFTQDPEKQMKHLCDLLDIPYDPEFINKWGAFETVTGDVYGDGRGRNEKIETFGRLNVESEILKRISENQDYQYIVDQYGYDFPLPDPALVHPDKLKRDRNRSLLLSQYGENLYLKGNKKTALKAFNAAIEIWPLNSTAFNNLGVHFHQTGDVINAMERLMKAADVNTHDKDAVMNLAMMYAIYLRPDLANHLLLDYLDNHENDADIIALYEEYKDRKMGQEY